MEYQTSVLHYKVYQARQDKNEGLGRASPFLFHLALPDICRNIRHLHGIYAIYDICSIYCIKILTHNLIFSNLPKP
jgi:hypothetical protein